MNYKGLLQLLTADQGANVKKSGSQAILTGTQTALEFDEENYDTNSYHDTSTNNSRFTCPAGKDGKFLLTGSARFDNNATGQRNISLFKNGTKIYTMSQLNQGATSDTINSITGILELVEDDYVELMVWQNSGGDLNVFKTSTIYAIQRMVSV